MAINIRPRGSGGTSFELRISHRLLPKPVYRTCSSWEEAEQVGALANSSLEQGVVPDWLIRIKEKRPTISHAIRAYLSVAAVPHSTEELLDMLDETIGSVALAELNWNWVEQWLRGMKTGQHLAPGTIRKRKGALSRVLKWVTNAHPLWLARSPLDNLPRGYSSYDRRSREMLAAERVDIPVDVTRERRIDPPAEAAIIAVLRGRIEIAETDEARAESEGLLLMFRLAMETAMRMREIYTITQDSVANYTEAIPAQYNCGIGGNCRALIRGGRSRVPNCDLRLDFWG